MIRRVTLRRFKRFDEVSFELPGHIVLAGPNNTGKTTVLQAIAAWDLAFRRWKQLNDFQRHGGAYTRAPIARPNFFAVPLRTFDLLWLDRAYVSTVEMELHHDLGWHITMELIADSTEQIYVRPKADVTPDVVRSASLGVAFVPAMTGLSTDEPVYQPPKLNQLLGQAKPGEVLRNLLLEASADTNRWGELQSSIYRLFGYTLLPPDATGPNILAEFTTRPGGPRLDIAGAGSGFQQVLMLLTFLYTRPASVLLLDEPDAHLHIILQDSIYSELRQVAAQQKSQLIIATHSEVLIDSVDLNELRVLLDGAPREVSPEQRRRLGRALGILSNTDIMQAGQASGVLYLENYTDLEILRAWARVLGHPISGVLDTRLFWKAIASGPRAREHYNALQLGFPELPALELVDGDARPELQATEITGQGLQRLRWRRYEIENYLVHPSALARFVQHTVGGASAGPHLEDLRRHFEEQYPPAVIRNNDWFGDNEVLVNSKARETLIPRALSAAGLPGIPYTRYHEIAALMRPEEAHPEVQEKLDLIQRAFRL